MSFTKNRPGLVRTPCPCLALASPTLVCTPTTFAFLAYVHALCALHWHAGRHAGAAGPWTRDRTHRTFSGLFPRTPLQGEACGSCQSAAPRCWGAHCGRALTWVRAWLQELSPEAVIAPKSRAGHGAGVLCEGSGFGSTVSPYATCMCLTVTSTGRPAALGSWQAGSEGKGTLCRPRWGSRRPRLCLTGKGCLLWKQIHEDGTDSTCRIRGVSSHSPLSCASRQRWPSRRSPGERPPDSLRASLHRVPEPGAGGLRPVAGGALSHTPAPPPTGDPHEGLVPYVSLPLHC